VDVVVKVTSDKEEDFLRSALQRFAPRLPDALPFATRHRVLLLSASDGTPCRSLPGNSWLRGRGHAPSGQRFVSWNSPNPSR
jgi:hypothetical protein